MKTNIIIFLILAFSGILSLQKLQGQTTITGSVSDKKGEPLPGASVYLLGTYDGVSSDVDGYFSFETDETGTQILKIDFMGFEGFQQEVVLEGKNLNFDVVLKEKFNQMTAVTITAGSFEAGDEKRSATLSSLDMVTTAGAMGDVYGALQTLPGTTTNAESGKLFVKGGSSEESQTYIDGTLVHVPYNSSPPLTGTRGRFDPFMFKGTVFSTGGYSAEYGQALSSVLLLRTNDMPAEDELNISLLSVGAGLAGTKKWKSGAITASLNYSNLKPYMEVAPQNYDWKHPPEYYNTDFSIRQKTGETGMFKFYTSLSSSNMSLNRVDLDNEGQIQTYDLKNDNVYVNGSWQTMIGKNWVYRSGVSLTENRDRVAYGAVRYKETLRGMHYKNVLSHQAGEKVNLRMGADFFAKEYTSDYTENSENFLGKYNDNAVAAYAEAEVYLSNKFVTRAGGRLEYSGYLKKTNISPRISTAYKFDDFSQISLAYGRFYQDPLNDYLIYTNRVSPERADHYILTVQSVKNKRTLRSEIYIKEYKDLVKVNSEEFYMPTAYNNNGSGHAYGLDIFWRDNKTFKNAEYWISYGYLDTKRDFMDYPFKSIPTFASKHNLSVVYKHWVDGIRSLVGMSYKFSSPRVYHDPNLPGFNNRETIPYQTLDVNISYLHRENIIFYAAITNVPGFKQDYGNRYAETMNSEGVYSSETVIPGSDRFFLVACFITLSKRGDLNQLDEIE
jgi:hypothetical protein